MASAASPRQEIIRAYRTLLRAGLQGVRYSTPSRYVVVNQLRAAFRDPSATFKTHFDLDKIMHTVTFLRLAGKYKGFESKILKNICHVAWTRQMAKKMSWKQQFDMAASGKSKQIDRIKATQYEHYDRTIRMLNETMGMCLPVQ